MVQDYKAISLLRDFVKEKLGGDIRKLKTYDFSSLDDDRKYGSTNHTEAPIVKAVMSLAFGDVWSELSMDHIDRGPYKCATIQTYQNLFGINMCDQYFKGMQYFKPLPSQFQRALKVAHMTYSIGNLWVLPGNGTISNCILDNSYRYYMDKFLKNIYAVLTQQKRVDKTLQKAIENSPQMKPYYGEEGFKKFISDMMLEDYVDYYGKPMDIFDFVWSSQSGLDREKYFNAVDQYCSFCEKAFVKRAEKIIEKLDAVLSVEPDIQRLERPIAVTQRPKPDNNQSQKTSDILNRYTLAYQFIPMSIDFAKEDIGVRLPIMAEKDYHIRLSQKLGLNIEGFTWDEFSVSVEDPGDGFIVIFFIFPKPQKEPEALYGAIVLDRMWSTLEYYTLEKCSHPGRWALGKNTTESHSLMGMYDIEPTKKNFFKLILPKQEVSSDIDIINLLGLPDNFKIINKMPEDPDECVNYGMGTPFCKAFIQAYPISQRKSMPFDDTSAIIDGIHETLSDKQALIEVKNGVTSKRRRYIYSIIKNAIDTSGVAYFMLLHVQYKDATICINAHYIESGKTGMRDTMILELAYRQGIVTDEDKSKWWFDPYDKDNKHPFLMNYSEKEEFDKMFPDHPLSQCRKFVKLIIERL